MFQNDCTFELEHYFLEKEKKHITILGSTGSIGTQTLEVIEQNIEQFEIDVLTARANAELLIQQALKFKPNSVVITDESKYNMVQNALFDHDIKVYTTDQALCEVVEMQSTDIVVTSMVGYAGLKPTLSAIKAGKNIALANKETLVVAGEIITKLAREKGVNIYPIDSEHSAIFQCIVGEFHNKIEKIILTASGGPFRGKTRAELEKVTKAQALKHPNWDMGAKITIDSASLMNKGLEVIEAKWLFGLKTDQIEVVVHPQSIIHSAVQFQDGSIKAQMGLPDMKIPIQYALTYPNRIYNSFKRFNFLDYSNLSFEAPDLETFKNLKLAFQALEKGGNMPCVLNAANEIAVELFLEEKISFLQMSELIEKCMQQITFIKTPSLEDLIASDQQTRLFARNKKRA